MYSQSAKRAAVFMLLLFILALAALPVLADSAGAPSGNGIQPVYYSDLPSSDECRTLGYDFGYKVDASAPNGTWNIDAINTVTIANSDGQTFDWSSTLGLDAVVVKAGSGANVYIYDPESMADTLLHSPIGDNGVIKQVSHVTFCFDYELDPSKTADGAYDRVITWELDKSVSPATHTGFAGENAGTSTWMVVATKNVQEKNFKVTGTIYVKNPTPFVVEFAIDDTVNGSTAIVVCPTFTLGHGDDTTCSYSVEPGDKSATLNTAEISVVSVFPDNPVNGATVTAPISWTPTTIGDESVTVDDDRNPAGFPDSISDTTTWTYNETFACSSNPDDYTDGKDTDSYVNTATADGNTTDLEDSAQVDVTCYAPLVSKTANTYFERDWSWTIDKTGSDSDLTLAVGQSFTVDYTVTLTPAATDSAFAVYGWITVVNPNPVEAMVVALSDQLSDGTVAPISLSADCDYDGAVLTVPAGATASCYYETDAADGDPGTNTATATLNNIDFSGSQNYAFTDPDVETGECVFVEDDQYGPLGQICAGDAVKTFEYFMTIGPFEVCGEYTFVNIAKFSVLDTGATGSASWTVNINVPCGSGCTLTQGYWKTHSQEGPAPYDEAWKLIGSLEEDTLFFLSSQTYFDVLWTPPAGNPYYTLAHQYIAAELNILNGASVPANVEDAMADAKALFDEYTPQQVDQGSRKLQRSFKKLIEPLDDYNNGEIGPGHCSEEGFTPDAAVMTSIAPRLLPQPIVLPSDQG